MSNRERTGKRDLSYSGFHRRENFAKLLETVYSHITDYRARARQALVDADRCTMIDIDACEYCKVCGTPLALIEVKYEQATTKVTTVTEALGELALLPVYLVEYWTDDDRPGEITQLRVTPRYPDREAPRTMTPCEYVQFVLGIHDQPHGCRPQRRESA